MITYILSENPIKRCLHQTITGINSFGGIFQVTETSFFKKGENANNVFYASFFQKIIQELFAM